MALASRAVAPTESRVGARGAFTLIEILVAIFILSIGVLGASSLQASSLFGQYSAGKLSGCSNVVGAAVDLVAADSANAASYDQATVTTLQAGKPELNGLIDTLKAFDFDADALRATLTINVDANVSSLSQGTGQRALPKANQITATLEWTSKGQTRKCSAQTFYSAG